MRIAIVDDQENWRVCVEELIKKHYGPKAPLIDQFDCGERFYNQGKYDVVFMDIEMGEMDGFETVKRYKQNNSDALIVFLTTHVELSRRGYMVNAFRYIDKKFIVDEVEEALCAIDELPKKDHVVVFHVVNMAEMHIRAKDILFVETDKRNIIVHTIERDYISNRGIEEVEEELKNSGFFRCHKSYLVNLERVRKIDRVYAYFGNGTKAMISTRKYSEMKEKFFAYNSMIANS
ncbi:MAG: response regulator transcription factor [Agathobacter sp.]|nr:response regulator transcription factor [Agathobacter sp.]